MKLFTLLLLSFVVANTTMAQISKGQFLAGGGIGFESIKNEGINIAGYTTTTFFISPNIGYFMFPKFAGGLRLDFRIYKGTAAITYTQTNISLSPFLRYYLLPQKKMFNVLIDVSYIDFKSKYSYQMSPASSERTNGYNISVGPSIFLNEHVAIEFLAGYKHTKVKDIGDKTTTFNTGLGLQIHLGKNKS